MIKLWSQASSQSQHRLAHGTDFLVVTPVPEAESRAVKGGCGKGSVGEAPAVYGEVRVQIPSTTQATGYDRGWWRQMALQGLLDVQSSQW